MQETVFGAVDIGGTKVAVGLVTRDGILIAKDEFPTAGAAPAMERIAGFFGADGARKMAALGVACTGPIDPLRGTVGEVDLLPGWEGFRLRDDLARRLGVPVLLENECDAAALGEARWGSGNDTARFLYVSISTGIGAGLILDGKIYRGAGGAHPELGHHSIEAGGPACYCGSTGCWEALASGTAIAAWYRDRVGGGKNAREVFASARDGESGARDAVDRFTHYLGVGLANLITLYAPDRIALGGGLLESADLFLEAATEIARKRAGLMPDGVTIARATLGVDAGLIGAGAVGIVSLEGQGLG